MDGLEGKDKGKNVDKTPVYLAEALENFLSGLEKIYEKEKGSISDEFKRQEKDAKDKGKKGYDRTQTYKMTVTNANDVVNFEFITKLEHSFLKGMFLHYTDQNASIGSGIAMAVQNEEIFPDKEYFPCSAIKNTEGVSIKHLPYPIFLKIDYSTVRGSIVDGGKATAYPYSVWITLMTVQFK